MKCLLLLVALSLCTFESTAQNFFDLSEECIEKQKEYQRIWDRLLEDGEITKGTRPLKNGELRLLYGFEGGRVMRMTLHEIFTMLQNYNFLNLGPQHNYFEIPIGGENFLFRLVKGPHGQILVTDAGGKLVAYETILKVLDRENAKDLAEQMLMSLNEPIGEQTHWKETSPDVKKKMKLLMVLSQVAEEARPTDASINKVKEIMAEV